MSREMNQPEQLPSDESQTAKAGVFNGIANALSLLSSVLFIPVISRILPADDMGKAALFTSVREIVYAFLTLSLAQSIPLAMIDYKNAKARFISSVFLFASICTSAVFIAVFFFRKGMDFLFFGSEFLYYWFFIPIYCQLALDIIINYANFHNMYTVSSSFALLASPSTFILSLVLITNLPIARYITRIVALDFFIVASGLTAAAAIFVKGRFRMNMEHVRYGVRVCLPLIPYLISASLLNRSNIIIISAYEGSGKAGIYVMGFTVANIIYVVMMQVMKSWSPWVYRKLSQEDVVSINGASTHFVFFIFLACTGLMGIAPELIRLFTAAEYHECAVFISPIVAGMFFRFLNQLFFDISFYHKKNLFNVITSICVPVLNIVLGLVFIKTYGYQVCVYISTACYILLALAYLFHSRHLEKRRVYDMQAITVTSIGILILCAVFLLTIDKLLLRYSVISAVVIGVMYTDRKFVLTLANSALSRLTGKHNQGQ